MDDINLEGKESKEAIDEQEIANEEKKLDLGTPKPTEEEKIDPKLVELQMQLDNSNKINEGKKAEIEKLTKQLTVKLEALEDPDQYIPKKTAAFEVYREVVQLRNTYIYSIIFILLVSATSAYIVFIGAIISGIIAMGFAVMMLRKMQRMKELEGRYGLTRPKLFRKV